MTIEARQKLYLKAMGIDIWHEKTSGGVCEEPITDPARSNHHTNNPWQDLQKRVSQCQLCGLCKTRTQTVFGNGNQHADLMIIGEAPGAHEDKEGKPFVGRAGELLTAMLKSVGISREEAFIANILKCRPPNNRDPSAEEVAKCTPYLKQQISFIQPKVIVTVGRIAAHHLLDTTVPLGRLRTQRHNYADTPLIVTYHPAYLLRSPKEKQKAYTDWIRVLKALNN